MRIEDAVAALLVLATVAYGVLAGADFGGGIWDALAFGPRRKQQREAIANAMAPVWEANHVWLIFMVVILFTAFPAVYAHISTRLFLPLHLVLFGIVLRGAAFVFRSYSDRPEWGRVFGVSSLITPFLLGCILGVIASGSTNGIVWLQPVPLLFGAFGVALCAYLAAVYLCLESDGELQEDFRKCALLSGTAAVGLSITALPFLQSFAPHLTNGLLSRGLPVIIVGVIAALLAGISLLRRRYHTARVATILQTSALIIGWALAQHPYLVYPTHTIYQSAAPAVTLRFTLIATGAGMLLLLPSLWYLFKVFKTPASS